MYRLFPLDPRSATITLRLLEILSLNVAISFFYALSPLLLKYVGSILLAIYVILIMTYDDTCGGGRPGRHNPEGV